MMGGRAMRRRWSRVTLVALAVTLAAAVGGTVEQGQARADRGAAAAPVKVGIIYSRTGLLSAYGAQYIQGLRLGLSYATNGTNRVGGRQIQITAVDDGTDPAKAVSAAKDLIGQGYKIIGGSVSSGVALQVAPRSARSWAAGAIPSRRSWCRSRRTTSRRSPSRPSRRIPTCCSSPGRGRR